jgi:hypothetical protein
LDPYGLLAAALEMETQRFMAAVDSLPKIIAKFGSLNAFVRPHSPAVIGFRLAPMIGPMRMPTLKQAER